MLYVNYFGIAGKLSVLLQFQSIAVCILFIAIRNVHMWFLLMTQIVEVYERDRGVGYNHFLLEVLPSTHDAQVSDALDDIPQVYLRPGHLLQLDTFICTHGVGAQLYSKLYKWLTNMRA